MNEGLKNIQESQGEPLSEIAKRVNFFLEPILEENFDLKSRKEYILANLEEFDQRKREIMDRAESLGLIENDIIDPTMARSILDADAEYKKTKKLIDETKPNKTLSLDLAEKIKEYDKNGRLEKEISRIYGLKEGMDSWRVFLVFLSVILPEDPFYWEKLKENSESAK